MTYSQTMIQARKQLRDQMAEMLLSLTDAQRDVFRRMYNYDGKHARDVDGVPDDKLDWAFYQIEQTPKVGGKS